MRVRVCWLHTHNFRERPVRQQLRGPRLLRMLRLVLPLLLQLILTLVLPRVLHEAAAAAPAADSAAAPAAVPGAEMFQAWQQFVGAVLAADQQFRRLTGAPAAAPTETPAAAPQRHLRSGRLSTFRYHPYILSAASPQRQYNMPLDIWREEEELWREEEEHRQQQRRRQSPDGQQGSGSSSRVHERDSL